MVCTSYMYLYCVSATVGVLYLQKKDCPILYLTYYIKWVKTWTGSISIIHIKASPATGELIGSVFSICHGLLYIQKVLTHAIYNLLYKMGQDFLDRQYIHSLSWPA